MKAPTSTIGQLAAAGGALVGAAWLGAQVGAMYQTDTTKTAAARTAGGTLGGFVAALGGLAVAYSGQKSGKWAAWAPVGLYTAGLSVGIYTAGIATLATAAGGPLSLAPVTPAAQLGASTVANGGTASVAVNTAVDPIDANGAAIPSSAWSTTAQLPAGVTQGADANGNVSFTASTAGTYAISGSYTPSSAGASAASSAIVPGTPGATTSYSFTLTAS
jgi:hypothetical protein